MIIGHDKCKPESRPINKPDRRITFDESLSMVNKLNTRIKG
jgi:hypothetical protein